MSRIAAAEPRAGAVATAADAQKPLLLVDVDGVISLFGFDPAARPEGGFHSVDGVVHFLSAQAGRHLLALMSSFQAVWCSGWEEKANEYLPHLLGLPGPLPFLRFGRDPAPGAAPDHPHWKLGAITAYASTRPLAWIDDDLERCRDWARERPAPTLLVATDPARGLTMHEAQVLHDWCLSVTGDGGGAAGAPGDPAPVPGGRSPAAG